MAIKKITLEKVKEYTYLVNWKIQKEDIKPETFRTMEESTWMAGIWSLWMAVYGLGWQNMARNATV